MQLLVGLLLVATLPPQARGGDDPPAAAAAEKGGGGGDGAGPSVDQVAAMLAQDAGPSDPVAEMLAQAQEGGPGQIIALPPMMGMPFVRAGGGPVAIHVGPEVLGMDMGPGDLMDLLDMGPLAAIAGANPMMMGPMGGGGGSSMGVVGGPPMQLGPAAEGGPPPGLAAMLEMLDQQMQQAAKHSGDFEVTRQGDKMQLVAMLPEYKESPPSVEVLGNSLVVRGKKASGNVVHSFQKSFQLPRGADTDAIKVEYSKSDGKLSIDVPTNTKVGSSTKGGSNAAMTLSSEEQGEVGGPAPWELDPLSGGSQMTIMFSGDGGEQMHGPGPFVDPLLDMLLGHAPFEGRRRGASPAEPQPAGGASGSKRRPAPVAVQPKNAKPFWRLVNDGLFDEDGLALDPAIEIVAPRGVELGKVQGGRIATYNATSDDALRGQRAPTGHLALPVSVGEKDCKWASGPDSVSPWLPLWMLGGTGLAVAAIVHYLAGNRRAAGKMSRKLESKLVKVGAGICVCCLLLGVLLSAYLLHRHRDLALEERVLHCRVDPTALKKVGVRVQGEL